MMELLAPDEKNSELINFLKSEGYENLNKSNYLVVVDEVVQKEDIIKIIEEYSTNETIKNKDKINLLIYSTHSSMRNDSEQLKNMTKGQCQKSDFANIYFIVLPYEAPNRIGSHPNEGSIIQLK